MTKDIEKPTLAEKQAFWNEQLPLFKEHYILQSQLNVLYFHNNGGNFEIKDNDAMDFEKEDLLEAYHSVNTSWAMWIRAVSHMKKKLEGCVVVPKDQIETWWQDAEEPENFETEAQNIHSIADGIDDGDIIEFHEHHTIHLPSFTLFGVWTYKEGKRVFITGTRAEVVEAARGGNNV